MRQVAMFAVENAEMRAEELVGGTPQKIAIPGLHIDTLVGRKVNRIDIEQRPYPVYRIGDARDIDQSAGSIGGRRHRHQPGLGPQQAEQMLIVQPTGGHVHSCLMHHHAAIRRRLLPAGNVGVVIERADDDLVTGLPLPRQRSAERKGQGGEVGAEHYLLCPLSPQQRSHRLPGPQHLLLGHPGREKGPPDWR